MSLTRPRAAEPAPLTARLVRLVETAAHEGPVYVAGEDALYFTTLPGESSAVIGRLALDGDRLSLEPERLSVVPASVTRPCTVPASARWVERTPRRPRPAAGTLRFNTVAAGARASQSSASPTTGLSGSQVSSSSVSADTASPLRP